MDNNQFPSNLDDQPTNVVVVDGVPVVKTSDTSRNNPFSKIKNLLSSRNFNNSNRKSFIVIGVSVGLLIIIGFVGVTTFSGNKDNLPGNTGASLVDRAKDTTSGQDTASGLSPTNSVGSPSTPQPSATPNSPSANPQSPQPSAQTKTYCNSPGMPEGVCAAISSIEKDGLRNNQYIIQDTSDVPEGIVVAVDRASWKNIDQNSGQINFKANAGGTQYNGVAQLIIDNGVWKISSYSLSQ